MNWIHLGIALFCIPGNLLAQEGYNYPAPEQQFSGTPSNLAGQQESTGSQAESPTGTQFPQGSRAPSNGFQRPIQRDPPTNRPIPGAQQNGYANITPSSSRPKGPQPPMQNVYQAGGRPSSPSGLYGTPSFSQPRPGSTQGYPGSTQGYPGSTPRYPAPTNRPAEQGYPGQPGIPQGYPGPSIRPGGTQGYPGSTQRYPAPTNRPTNQEGYPGQPGLPQGFPGPSIRPGSPQYSYPGSSAQPGSQSGYPDQTRPSGGPVSPQTEYPGQPGTSQGFPGAAPGTGQPGQGQGEQGISDEQYEEGDYSAIPGEPDKDYPILSYIPETSFSCDQQQYPGYYADVEARCQVFHICANNKTYDFLCPNGTVFHQEHLVCVWWNQFDCNSAPSLFAINANIYDYSIIGAQQGFGTQGQGGGPQGPNNYPQGGTTGPGGNVAEQRPSEGYPSDNRPQGFGFSGQNGQRPEYQQRPGYPTTQAQTPGYPTTPRYPGYQSTPSYEGSSSQRPGGYPQQPGFPARPRGPSQQTNGYPSGRPQGPTFPGLDTSQRPVDYPNEGGRPQGPSNQGSYPNQRPGYATTIQPSSEGYPNGLPPTPFPGTSRPQEPTREYLPPF